MGKTLKLYLSSKRFRSADRANIPIGKAADKSFEHLPSSGGIVSNYPLKIESDALFIDINNESGRNRFH